jgi:hypothetical protein
VYELKNEVPSFEEFMKTYEEPVNYDDLNSWDIGSSKGYGPCTSDYCSCSNYELRQQLRSLKQQTKEDVDNFWEKFKEYDGKWENYKSNVSEYFDEREKAGAVRGLGSKVIDAIPIPFLSTISNSLMDSVDNSFEMKYEQDRKNFYSRTVGKYNEIKDWYYRIRNRYC